MHPDFKSYYKATVNQTEWLTLAKRQKYTPMKQNRKTGNKTLHTCDFQQGCQGQSFKQMVLGKLDIHMQKNKVEPLTNIIYEK